MNNNIFIPKICKVGFQDRDGTYTGKLGYVICHDGKKWRKEHSWTGWIHKYIEPDEYEREKNKAYNKAIDDALSQYGYYSYLIQRKTIKADTREEAIEKIGPYDDFEFNIHDKSVDENIKPVEFENVPVEGFVLNKKAGGYSSGWNHRQTYCRVYDPRGFEFEIGLENLLYILENTNSIKGKGLEGKFIYGWHGKDLILVPENSPEFTEMQKFTELQEKRIKKADLEEGGIYLNSKNKKVIYLGYYPEYNPYTGIAEKRKKHWFFEGDDIEELKKEHTRYSGRLFLINPRSSYSNLREKVGVSSDFADIIDVVEKMDERWHNFKEDFVEVTEEDLINYFLLKDTGWDTYFDCFLISSDSKSRFGKRKGYVIKSNKYKYNNRGRKDREPTSSTFRISTRYGTYHDIKNYKTILELLKNNTIWQQKTTKSS